MFDTITGLPVHVLVLHLVVVGLPALAVVTIVVSVRKNLRERYSWWVAGANFVMFLITLVEKGGPTEQLEFAQNEITIGRLAGNDIVLATDSKRTFGGNAVPENNLRDVKLRRVGAAYLATTGWGVRRGDR